MFNTQALMKRGDRRLMGKKISVLLCTAMLAVVLSGCSGGVDAKMDFTFEQGGGFEQSVDVQGIELEDEQVTALESGGWKVSQESSGFQATCSFDSASSYTTPAGTLYGALLDSFVSDAGYDPGVSSDVAVVHHVTDYVLATRHDVEVKLPRLDLAPTDCQTCEGSGWSDCPSCNAGTRACSECDGTGYTRNSYYSYSYSYTTTCYWCDGTGRETCSYCDGSGQVYCEECDGTGDAPERVQAAYDESLSASKLDVAINMPGITVKNTSGENASWKLKGSDIEDADTFTATSYVIDWTRAGITAAILLLILALLVWLIVRSIKKKFKKKPPVAAPAAPIASQTSMVSPTPMGACPSCGAPFAPGAKFCRACGAQVGNGDES